MQNEEMSMIDAFCALKDVDEVDLPRLREGKSFDVMNGDQMEKAREFRDKHDKDDTLEVIDVNADDLEHLRDNKEYVGQVILSCKKCHAKKFIDMDQLKASEADKDLYNLEDECPNCHATGDGYTIEGQVGKFEGTEVEPEAVDDQEVVPEEEPEPLQGSEETTDTDLPAAGDLPELDSSDLDDSSDESSSDESSEDVSDDVADDASKDDETAVDNSIDDEESDGMDTDTHEDDDDEKVEAFHDDQMDQLNAIDDDDNNYFKDFDSALSDKGSDDEPVWDEPVEEEPKKKLKLRFKEDFNDGNLVLAEIFDNMVDPEIVGTIQVMNDMGDIIFEGPYDELTSELINCSVVSWSTSDSMLVINADSDTSNYEGSYETVADVLEQFDSFDDNITIFDDSSSEEVFTGTKDEAVEMYGDLVFLSLEAPAFLNVVTENNIKPYSNRIESDLSPLEEDIFRANKLSPRKVNNPKCDEYWIHESIKSGEDLDVLFEHYIRGTALVDQFKRITGYKDAVDEAYDLTETKARNDDMNKALEKAKKLGKEQKAYSVVYGYTKDGKFYAISDPYVCRDNKEHQMAAELTKAKYHAYTINAVYDRQFNEQLNINTTSATKMEIDDDSAIISSEDHKINVDSDSGTDVQVNDDGSVEVRKSVADDSFDDMPVDDEPIDDEPISDEPADDVADIDNDDLDDVSADDVEVPDLEDAPVDDEEHQEVEPIPAPEDSEEDSEEAEEESPKDEMLGQYRSRKELTEALKQFQRHNIRYTIRRSANEGYRYDVLREANELATIDEPEVIDAKKANRSEVAPNNLSDTEIEVLNKICDISKNIAASIKKYYGIDADPRLIVADMVQDLRLVSGDLNPEDLPNTPMNQVTKEMYSSYNSFYDVFDSIVTLMTGEEYHTTSERKLQQAIEMLDSPNFSPEATDQAIASDYFLEQVRKGAVPFIPQDQVPMIESFINECDNKPECTGPDCEKSEDKPEDVQLDSDKDEGKTVLNEEPEEETVDMEICKFDESLNEYFNEAYEETVLYTSTKGYIDGKGNILLEGYLKSEEADTPVQFTLCPSKRMNEGIEETVYHVTNNLSQEEFEFTF